MTSSQNESRQDPRLILLHPEDDVAAAATPLEAGDVLTLEGRSLPILDPIPRGHKFAVRDLRAGDKIRKYGAPIGSATRTIRAGEWVHHHNLESDYLPTPERGTESVESKEET